MRWPWNWGKGYVEASTENLRRESEQVREQAQRSKIATREVQRRAQRASDKITKLLAGMKDGDRA